MSKDNKSKIINKKGIYQFVIYSRKGQQLNEREIFAISGQVWDGLISPEVKRKGTSFELVYDLSGMITLKEYLINPLNKESFGKLLQNVLDVFKMVETAFFKPECMLMDFDKVMVNTATQRLNFIYIPIQGYNIGGTLRSFLLEIIQRGAFVATEDSTYVTEYIKILNTGLNFSIFELEEYITGLVSGTGYETPKTITCFKCGTQLSTGAIFCSVCGVKIAGNTGEMENRVIYDPFSNVKEDAAKGRNTQKTDVNLEIKGVTIKETDVTQGLSDTTREVSGSGDTMLLGMYESMYDDIRYLVREKTEEKISISKDVFRLGKSAQECDYAVVDNKAISRKHAEIVKQENGYFIVDLGSTNKTYVDDNVVVHHKQIISGSKIRLANEEFTFYIE